MSGDLERRLRESLRAYAETVDAPDVGTLPEPAAEPRPLRRWRGAVLAAAAAVAIVAGSLLVVADRDPGSGSAAGPAASASTTARGEAPERTSGTTADQALPGAAALPPSPQPGVVYAVGLYTHCGVLGIDVGGVWFAADPPLMVEYGPPPGWGNPYQPGTVTLLSATRALFADDLGHEVRLRADEAARPPLCA